MITDVTPYVALKRIVAWALDEAEKSGGDRDKAWQFAFRAMVDLGMNIAWEPITVRIALNPNGTADYPPDCIKWTKIGVLNASGEVSTLKINRSLTLLKDTNPSRSDYLTPDVPDVDFRTFTNTPYFFNYYFNNYYSPLFGIGNGLLQYGECNPDDLNRIVVMDPAYPFDHIVFEYISSPMKNQDYQVRFELQEPIIAFILWKFKMGTEADYYARAREARRKLDPVRLQTVNEAIRENHGFKLKA